ncbi:U32 family peptidase [Candidatus Gracilibacteria bacterium]|nr:U32 family peptidase [Candidatus Gracilibacteria bacterium]
MFKKIVGLGFSTKGKKAKDLEKYIASLVEGGANEFFTGYNPSYWSDKFGFEVSPNGRFAEHEQITDFETLKLIVQEVHKYDLEIFINLNAWYYTDETFPLIQKMVSEFQELGIDGIICGNISILEYLKDIGYKGKINISTIMAVYNSEAIRFLLENYEINKIILSREITLKEIEQLVTEFKDTQFEVFGEGDFCRYNNGLCFAEHKYGAKDICTIVVNDLIIKKKFKPDFKEIILDTNLSNEEKIEKINDEYFDIFEQINSILEKIEIGLLENKDLEEELIKIINISKNRVDLFFDALKPINDKRNTNILIYLRALKYLNRTEFKDLQDEIENSVKTGIKYLSDKTKLIGGKAKLKALELGNFYARGDNLNLYTYLFFSKFKNIETVKFPTRGRNYNEKMKVIEETLKNGKIDKKYLDRGINIERAHYDLTYLFGDKLWFRDLLREIK